MVGPDNIEYPPIELGIIIFPRGDINNIVIFPMAFVEEAADVVYFVPLHGFHPTGGVGHRNDPWGDIAQVQVEFRVNKPLPLFTHEFSQKVHSFFIFFVSFTIVCGWL